MPILGGWTSSSSEFSSSGLPAGMHTQPQVQSTLPEEQSGAKTVLQGSEELVETIFTGGKQGQSFSNKWTWERVEEIRQRGLELATAFDNLDGLKDVMDVEGEPALGSYIDLI
jgi:hypothetical protein